MLEATPPLDRRCPRCEGPQVLLDVTPYGPLLSCRHCEYDVIQVHRAD